MDAHKLLSLEDFISETLFQMVNGVSKAQERVEPLGGRVNPRGLNKDNQGEWVIGGSVSERKYAQFIEFDIAVTIAEDTQGKVGVGLFSAVAFGGQAQLQDQSSTVHRIKFSIPITLPVVN